MQLIVTESRPVNFLEYINKDNALKILNKNENKQSYDTKI